ncbi:hypothetical protein PUN28_017280 [Cardiocondyla obscurior]|uniref:Uncharacterized protein n=1 Tax=Cardiocondyla obscurior TaxID=286306 RepID=A0AAW2EMB8_9HYME
MCARHGQAEGIRCTAPRRPPAVRVATTQSLSRWNNEEDRGFSLSPRRSDGAVFTCVDRHNDRRYIARTKNDLRDICSV